jgi:CHAT domain-containing protein
MAIRAAGVLLLAVGLAAPATADSQASPPDPVRGLLAAGRYAEAIETIEGALRHPIGPTCGWVEPLTQAYAGVGDPFGSRAALETVAAQATGVDRMRAGLALARLDLADRNLDGVLTRTVGLLDALPADDHASRSRLELIQARSLAMRGDAGAAGHAARAARSATQASAPERSQLLLSVAESLEASPALRSEPAIQTIASAPASRGPDVPPATIVRESLARAIAYRLAGRAKEAVALARRAQYRAQQADDAALEHRAATVLGQSHRDAGDAAAAVAAFDAAIARFEAARVALVSEAVLDPIGVRQRLGGPFLGLADLLLAQARHADGDAAAALRWRVIDAMERFKAAELQEFFLDACAGATAPVTPRELAARLQADTALFYPVVLDDRIEWLVHRGGELRQATAGDARGLEARTRAYRDLVQRRGSTGARESASALYEELLAPAAALAGDATRWLYVPDDWLRLLPLPALHDGDDWLVARVAIATAPILMAATGVPAGDSRPVLAGLSKAVQGFPALPGVDAELDALKTLLADEHPGLLTNEAFGLTALEQQVAMSRPRLVHLATHGEIGRRADQSFLLTWDGRIQLGDLDRLLRDSGAAPIDLLVLSACQTASGDERAALGLGGVALQAGANRVLATLWYISDAASSTLMPAFYRGVYERGQPPAEALREAQLALARSEAFGHPAYWAPFTLIERIERPAVPRGGGGLQ